MRLLSILFQLTNLQVNRGERERLLGAFNAMADRNMQNTYLRDLIEVHDVKRRGAQGKDGVAKGEEPGKRKFQYSYYVNDKDLKRIEV